MSPTVRVMAGRALRTVSPRRRASVASGAGRRAAPAPASTSGTIASRAAVCTAICLFCTLGFEDSDLDPRVSRADAADQAGHRIDRERRERGDLDRAASQFEHAGDRVTCFIDRSLNLPSRADQRLARCGQSQAATNAVKQLDAEFGLERAHRLGKGRLGDVESLGSVGGTTPGYRRTVTATSLLERGA